MIISPHTGKIVHHKNCTHCALRHQKNVGTKTRKRERETCLLTKAIIPPPGDKLPRYCGSYTQINCSCDVCSANYKRFDIETLLDKKDKLW